MPDVHFPNVTQMAIPIFIVAILLELFLIRFRGARGSYETRDTLTSLLMGGGNVVSGLILGVVSYLALMWVWQYRIFDWGLTVTAGLVAFVIDDFRYYWYPASPIRAAGFGRSMSIIIPASITIYPPRCANHGRGCSPACSFCKCQWRCSASIPRSSLSFMGSICCGSFSSTLRLSIRRGHPSSLS